MSVEAATFLSQLDQNLPSSGGIAGEGDDHLRLLKQTILNTIPFDKLVSASADDLNTLTGAAAAGLVVADLTKLADVTASAAELNTLDGITAGVAELNLLAGRTLASADDVIDNFPAGTLMLFQQQVAPTGWTRQTTHNNRALRIVNGSTWAGSGGTAAFSTVFGRTATDSHVLSGAESGAGAHTHGDSFVLGAAGGHSHTLPTSNDAGSSSNFAAAGAGTGGTHNQVTSTVADHNHTLSGSVSAITAIGASSGHTHGVDMRVQYVDIIVAAKN